MSTISPTLDLRRLEAIAAEFGATDLAVRAAILLAANKAAVYAEKLSRTEMHREQGVSLGALRRRLRRFAATGTRADGRARYSRAQSEKALRRRAGVWFGLNPVDAMDLSPKAKETKEGVRAGGKTFRGAFIAKDANGTLRVFRRRYTKDVYSTKHGLPIDRVFSDVFDGSLALITTDIFPKVADVFYTEFERAVKKYAGFLKG